MRLFCFTFAGGSGSFFDGLGEYVRSDVELVKLEYAGHIARHREAFYRDFDGLTADMYAQVKVRQNGQPYALLGYSMGALAAAEVVKTVLDRDELPAPAHVFLASHAPCGMSDGYDVDSAGDDETVKRWTIRFGGLSDDLIGNRTFWRMYLPVYRADYRLITGYDFGRLDFTVDVPADMFFSPEDIPPGDMEKWRGIFTGPCDIKAYSGGHFFLREHAREVAEVINERLGRYGV